MKKEIWYIFPGMIARLFPEMKPLQLLAVHPGGHTLETEDLYKARLQKWQSSYTLEVKVHPNEIPKVQKKLKDETLDEDIYKFFPKLSEGILCDGIVLAPCCNHCNVRNIEGGKPCWACRNERGYTQYAFLEDKKETQEEQETIFAEVIRIIGHGLTDKINVFEVRDKLLKNYTITRKP